MSKKKIEDRVVFCEGQILAEARMQIVRYTKTGAWWAEWEDGFRQHLPVAVAADGAVGLFRHHGGQIHLGLPGGRTFYSQFDRINANLDKQIEEQKKTEVANAITILTEFRDQCSKQELPGVIRAIEVLTHQ